jgi:type IV pilus assembly protein PilA
MKNVKNVKKNNKGFSLVELIVVIAIMAVLVGVLAPQFMGYVSKSKKSTDIKNGQEIASAISVALADDSINKDLTNKAGNYVEVTDSAGTIGGVIKSHNLLATLPTVKSDSAKKYYASYDASTGKVLVFCASAAPTADDAASIIYPTVGSDWE